MSCYVAPVTGFAGGFVSGFFGFGAPSCKDCYPLRRKCALITGGLTSVTFLAAKYMFGMEFCVANTATDTAIGAVEIIARDFAVSALVGYVYSKIVRNELVKASIEKAKQQ